MSQIVSRWITLLDEKAISLSGETWMRRLPFGRNWSKVRFGMLATVDAFGVSQDLTPTSATDVKIAIGLASEDTWSDGFINAKSAVGVSWLGNFAIETAQVMSTGASFPNAYYYGGAPRAFTMYNEPGAETGQVRLETAYSTGCAFGVDGGTDIQKRRGIYVVDITRNQGGVGPVTIDIIHPSTTAIQSLTATPADLMDVVSSGNIAFTVNNAALTRQTLSTIYVNEPGYGLNTLFIYQSNFGIRLLVYAVAAVVFNDTPFDTPGGSNYWFTQLDDAGTETPVLSSQLVGGQVWGEPYWNLNGTTNLLGGKGFSGTAAGTPWEIMSVYETSTVDVYSGSLATTALNAGTGWTGPAELYGTSANSPVYGLAGTSAGFPHDPFEQYDTGAVVSGVTINAGTGWDGPAVIN